MPEVCSPSVSRAVVYLQPADSKERRALLKQIRPGASSTASSGAEVVLVNQRGLQFTPRVQAMVLGQTVRFTNQDGETHNVHVVSPGFGLNQSMAPGHYLDFTPEQPGVMTLACDIHLHMRGFVVVSPTPWVQVCSREGRFRLAGVPDGRFVLTAWHEMGDPLRRELAVAGGKAIELPALVLTASLEAIKAAARGPSARDLAPVRPWSEVLDRIGVTLAASRDAATRPGELAKARRLADDAYWGEFEASDLETAVRKYLGYARAGELEQQFREFRSAVGDVAENRRSSSVLDDLSHHLLLDLVSAAHALNAKGVTDRSRTDTPGDAVVAAADGGPASGEPSTTTGPGADPRDLLQALQRGFHRVRQEAERNGPDGAASELTTVYMTEFEPLERYLLGRSPQSIRPLEIQFNTLRGDLAAGLKGAQLIDRLDSLFSEVVTLVERLEARPAGTFGPAFFASLITMLREGVEVILVLAMLIALVAKATPAAGSATRAPALRAIWWGVALAVAASLATALALNFLVSSAQGRARETLEGLVVLFASGVLFYVSYWLISQVEAKRWMDFLKQQARRGLEWGGRGTLALTAFLAVYREGAETSLMYQALLGSQGQTRPGFLGLAAGFLLGLVLLAAIAVLIRATSVRLPMRTFFKITGLVLFAMAVMFAGHGVFELQNAGVLLTTHLAWLGKGLPLAGLYPNLQVVSVQGLLLGGALLAWILVPRVSDGVGTSGGPIAQHEVGPAQPANTGSTTPLPMPAPPQLAAGSAVREDPSEPNPQTRPARIATRPPKEQATQVAMK
jgi:high-affinity iron transporter